ncbi:Gag-Pol polyprotein, partial [Schistosoma japonicum]
LYLVTPHYLDFYRHALSLDRVNQSIYLHLLARCHCFRQTTQKLWSPCKTIGHLLSPTEYLGINKSTSNLRIVSLLQTCCQLSKSAINNPGSQHYKFGELRESGLPIIF